MTLQLGGGGAITGCTLLQEPDLTVSGLTVNGDLDAPKMIVAPGTEAAPSYTFSGDTDTGLYLEGTNSIGVSTNGTNAILINSSGNVGIGVPSPQRKLHIRQDGAYALKVGGSSGADFYLELGQPGGSASPAINYTGPSASLRFLNNGNDVARFDSSGRLLVGATSAVLDTSNALVQLSATQGSNLVLNRDATTVGSTDSIGLIRFYSNAGNSKQEHGRITCIADGTSGANDKPGALLFYTTADGASSPTERLRIDSSGTIKQTGLTGAGGANKLARYVVPSHNTNEEDVLVFQVENESSSNQLTFGGGTASNNSATAILFKTSAAVDTTEGTERLRIDNTGTIVLPNGSPGIQFGTFASPVTSTTIDDYEEGSWTPTVITDGTGSTSALSISAVYRKFNDIIWYDVLIQQSNTVPLNFNTGWTELGNTPFQRRFKLIGAHGLGNLTAAFPQVLVNFTGGQSASNGLLTFRADANTGGSNNYYQTVLSFVAINW